MRIGYLMQPWDCGVPPNPGGSIGIWTWEIARRMAASHEVVVCARRRQGDPAREQHSGVRFERLSVEPDRWLYAFIRRVLRFRDPCRPGFASMLWHLCYAYQAARALRMHRCQIIHIHNFSQFVPIVRRLNPRARIVLHMHCEWLSQLDSAMVARRLAQADSVVCCADYLTQRVRQRFPRYARRCLTIHNGVDLAGFSAPADRARPASGSRRVVFVGRVSPEKGVHVLLEAFREVVRCRPETHLEIIGDHSAAPREFIVSLSQDPMVQRLGRFYEGDYVAHLRRQIGEGLAGRVSLVGPVPHQELMNRLRGADVFVQPSVWGEPFPLVVLEAMAAGLAVVASRAGGLVESVQDGCTGLLAEPDDADSLAKALLRVLQDDQLRRAMGHASRQRVEQLFSWEKATTDLQQHYDRLLHGPIGG